MNIAKHVAASHVAASEDFMKRYWEIGQSLEIVERIQRGERDSHLEEDLTFKEENVRIAAKARLEILRG